MASYETGENFIFSSTLFLSHDFVTFILSVFLTFIDSVFFLCFIILFTVNTVLQSIKHLMIRVVCAGVSPPYYSQ
jgi:hypothetical protein